MIVSGRVLEVDGASFRLRLDQVVGVDGLRDSGLVTVSADLLDPFAVVGGVDSVEVDGSSLVVSGCLDAVDGSRSTRRVRGLLAGRRVSRFVVEGRCLRLLHAHLDGGSSVAGVELVGVGS
ncbi:hypothetical protein HBA53_13210 [Rhodococcus pyridinivorans]|uniref:hypothetical protein n=1 Tax=Rhodococcus pyridinivorans TaxID=103816 RepID=UPI001C2FCB0B|nr:hypothetical protein [Rhodococcus pyridinivorans]QXF81894.1 hypothetical protein HBA53_13210 [Rhodococcus pyridinivorans]